MEKHRQVKIVSIIALVIAIVGMSLGFAAFSTTLNISSSANVSPDSGDFNVRFCNDYHFVGCEDEAALFWVEPSSELNGATGNVGTMSYKSIRNFDVNFTEPTQSVTYTFYVQNVGEYDAYLKDVSYTALSNGTYKMCSATTTDSTKADDSLVQAACDGIKTTISIGGTMYEAGSIISGHVLSKGATEEVQIKIEYLEGSAIADGPFKVQFSDFSFNYSTVDNELITFTSYGNTYQAVKGMTWEEWFNSNFYSSSVSYSETTGKIMIGGWDAHLDINGSCGPSLYLTDTIVSGGSYITFC